MAALPNELDEKELKRRELDRRLLQENLDRQINILDEMTEAVIKADFGEANRQYRLKRKSEREERANKARARKPRKSVALTP